MITSSTKNISEFPASIQQTIIDFVNKLHVILDDNIICMLVYGSAAGSNYNPESSNINMAVVLKGLDFNCLNNSLDVIKWGHHHKIATPLFLTKEYILNSLDVFPIEFAEIKNQHRLVLGEDIFKELDVPVKDVRLLCEQQVKGKLLHLRQAFLETGHQPTHLKKLLLGAFNDLLPVFRQLIVLKGQKPYDQKEVLLGQLAEIYVLDKGPLLAFHQDKNKKVLIASHQVEALFENFLNQLENLSRHLDSL